MTWLEDDSKQPPWLADVAVPRLLRHSPSGAIGKLIRSQFNSFTPKDPTTGHTIGFRPSAYLTEKHHIFPIKYLPTLHGWGKGDQGDVILNLMFLEADTNKRWINGNPADHLNEALAHRSMGELTHSYGLQLIEETALSVLAKPVKTKSDFEEFIVLREKTVQSHLSTKFEFPISGTDSGEEDADEQ